MRRKLPTWLGIEVERTPDRVVHEVVRIRDYPGYPPAPHVEGKITTFFTPLEASDERD